jgi:hypothetical protein
MSNFLGKGTADSNADFIAANPSGTVDDTDVGFYYADATSTVFDTSGYVFEISAFDVSHAIAVDPSFERVITELVALGDVSAAAVVDVSATHFNTLFAIKTDSADLDNVDATDVSFGVHTNALNLFNDISFSESVVFEGNINSSYTGSQQIKNDYIRDIAKQITGGYNSADIFANEAELVSAVVDLDASFSTSLNDTVDASAGEFEVKGSINTSLARAAANLFTLNLNDTNNTRKVDATDLEVANEFDATTINNSVSGDTLTSCTARVAMLREVGVNSGGATNSPVESPIRFAKGDKIALKFTYNPNQTTFAANGVVMTHRTYKVFLNLN